MSHAENVLHYLTEECMTGRQDIPVTPEQLQKLNRRLTEALDYPGRYYAFRQKTKTLIRDRHRLFQETCGVESSKQLSYGQAEAFLRFLYDPEARADLRSLAEAWEGAELEDFYAKGVT